MNSTSTQSRHDKASEHVERNIPRPPTSAEDKATTSYIRRTLCAHHAVSVGSPALIQDLLPPLTSSNATDLQLYAIIAVILKEFVQTWYSKITPDHTFIDEVLLIISHVTRGLEERVRKVNLQAVLLDELPQVLEQHISASRLAQQKSADQHLRPSAAAIYHALHPLPALEPVPDFANLDTLVEQERNERAWRHMLVQSVLAVVLPTEDLQNACLQSLVEEIIAEMILGNIVSNRLCQPWAIWELITNAIRASLADKVRRDPEKVSTLDSGDAKQSLSPSSRSDQSRLARFGLLAEAKAEDSADTGSNTAQIGIGERAMSWRGLFWTIINSIALLSTTASWLLTSWYATLRHKANEDSPTSARPVVEMQAWSCLANLLELPSRMPWLFGFLCLSHTMVTSRAQQTAAKRGKLDRFLSKTINGKILDPLLIPTILQSVRRTFFPANTFPKNAKSLPDSAAVDAIKRDCVQQIIRAVPGAVRTRYFGTGDEMAHAAAVDAWLDVFGDAYMNKHFVFASLELLAVRIIPELAFSGPKELLAQRLGPDVSL